MDNIIEFIMDYIVSPFMCIVTVGFVLLCVISVFCIPSCIKKEAEEKNK